MYTVHLGIKEDYCIEKHSFVPTINCKVRYLSSYLYARLYPSRIERVVEWLSELSRSSDLSGRALRRVGRAIEAVLCLTYTVLNYHACRSRRDDRNEYYMKAAKERNNIVQVQVQLHTQKL